MSLMRPAHVSTSPRKIVSQNGAQLWTVPQTRLARSSHVRGVAGGPPSRRTSAPPSGLPLLESRGASASGSAASDSPSSLASTDGPAAPCVAPPPQAASAIVPARASRVGSRRWSVRVMAMASLGFGAGALPVALPIARHTRLAHRLAGHAVHATYGARRALLSFESSVATPHSRPVPAGAHGVDAVARVRGGIDASESALPVVPPAPRVSRARLGREVRAGAPDRAAVQAPPLAADRAAVDDVGRKRPDRLVQPRVERVQAHVVVGPGA